LPITLKLPSGRLGGKQLKSEIDLTALREGKQESRIPLDVFASFPKEDTMVQPPFGSDDLDAHRQFELLRQFWDRFDETGESGQTSWEILDGIRSEVNDCFYRGPSAVHQAISLTAKAMLLMTGDYI
jgi:hypothetical protein